MVTSALRTEPTVLVYTRNFVSGGGGYVHQNIQASIDAIQNMGRERSFAVDVSDLPSAFDPINLGQYACIVFSNSNNEAFSSNCQREAFAQYIENGGGFLGIHSAAGSERSWPYFWSVLGGRLAGHSRIHELLIHVDNREHPATRHLPQAFRWIDECYYFADINPAIQPLLWARADQVQASSSPARKENRLPLAWCVIGKCGSRRFYTALGHDPSSYADPTFYRHICGGIEWVLGCDASACAKHHNRASCTIP